MSPLKRLPLLAVLLFVACVRQLPVTEELTIQADEGTDTVVVTASTEFLPDPETEHARAAALAGTDAWSVRFARLSTPEEEQLTYRRQRGTLERVTRSARIPADDLQTLLSDTNITVHVVRGEGWRELAFYPGSGGRATREQQREFDAALATWSESVARYFNAVHHLYSYLQEQPGRARYVFAALRVENLEEAPVLEEEMPLVEAVVDAMVAIAAAMDAEEGRAMHLADVADLVYNPFPARVIVRVPGDAIASEGFDKDLTIERVNLFEAVSALEGRWISPDPLAALLRDDGPTAEQLAEMPRKSQAVVSAGEIAEAIREQLVRPRIYSVRWRD